MVPTCKEPISDVKIKVTRLAFEVMQINFFIIIDLNHCTYTLFLKPSHRNLNKRLISPSFLLSTKINEKRTSVFLALKKIGSLTAGEGDS